MPAHDTRFIEVSLERASLWRAGRRLLREVSWRVRPGERWVLTGANGAGKTQLLKLLAGIVWPAPARHIPLTYRLRGETFRTPFGIKQQIAYVGAERQDRYERYGWNMSAERIVGSGVYRSDVPLERLTPADRRRIHRLLRTLRVAHLGRRPFLTLSYGERRVVLLARALIAQPRLLLLDEVLNGLDADNRRRILLWLKRPRRLPWVLATHRLEDVPPGASHALLLEGGRICHAGRLRRASLARWLHGPSAAVRSPRLAAARRRRTLVRLHNACVYLQQRRVLRGLSLAVHSGEWWLVHGHNGSGKTTLLRTLYGDHGVAAGGRIERAGIAPGVPLERFKKRVGLIAPHLQAEHPRQLTVNEVVRSGRHASIGVDAPRCASAAARVALRQFGLTRLQRRTLAELSYGQLRRVLFARAWAARPQLLLLDEAFAGLDAPTRRTLLERLRRLAAQGVAVVLTAPRPQEWAACATHELELAGGRALYCGPLRSTR